LVDEGLEQLAISSGNNAIGAVGAAESGAVEPAGLRSEILPPEFDHPDLQRLLSAWPKLSIEIRCSILALVDVGLTSAARS
jgi:hypothetical protein